MIWKKASTTRQALHSFRILFHGIFIFALSFLLLILLQTSSLVAADTANNGQPAVPNNPATGPATSGDSQAKPIEQWLPDPTLQEIAVQATGKALDEITQADCQKTDITITTDEFLDITNTAGLENFHSIRIEVLADKSNETLWHSQPASFSWSKWFGTANDFQSKTTLVLSHDLKMIFSPDGFQFASLKRFKAVEIGPLTIWRSDAALHLNPDNYRHFQIPTANLGIPSLDQNWSADGSRLTGFSNPNISYTAQPSADGTQIDFTLNNPSGVSYKDLSDQNDALSNSENGYQGSVSLPVQISGFSAPFNLLFNISFDSQPSTAAPITVEYLDDKGNDIAPSTILRGQIGDSYRAERKNIDGYYFREAKGNVTGKMSDRGQLVVFVYAKVDSKKSGSPASSSRSDDKRTSSSSKQSSNRRSSAASSSAKKKNQAAASGPISSLSSSSSQLLLSDKPQKGQLPVLKQVLLTLSETLVAVLFVLLAAFLYHRIKKKQD